MNVTNEEMDELKEILTLIEDEGILFQNKMMDSFLRKRGIKLREYKWTELIAS